MITVANSVSNSSANATASSATQRTSSVLAAAHKKRVRKASMSDMASDNDENMSRSDFNVASNTKASKLRSAAQSKKNLRVHKVPMNAKSKLLRSASAPETSFGLSFSEVARPKGRVTARVPVVKKSGPTSAELELIRIEEEKRAEQERMLSTKKTYELLKNKSPRASEAVHSNKELTIPKSPTLKLNARLGKRAYSIVTADDSVQAEPVPTAHSVPTTVQPFHFETEKRAKVRGSDAMLGSVCPIVPAAEIEASFMRDTRSHDVPLNAARSLTEPHTPKLMTKQRAESDARKAHIKSRDEIEQEEMEVFQKNPFRAVPVDKRIFESNEVLGVPKASPRPLTEPQPFNLRLEKRSSSRQSFHIAPSVDEAPSFKALPLPQFPPRPISPRPPESSKPLTIPVSPKLHGKTRASTAPANRQKPHHSEVEKQRQKESSAHKNTVNAHTVTQPVEFHFRTDERLRAKKRPAADDSTVVTESSFVKEFKAKPAPKFPAPTKSVTAKKELTEVVEFSLRSASRHQAAQNEFLKLVEEKKQQDSFVKPFKARRAPGSHRQ